jgi:hypothetical protein
MTHEHQGDFHVGQAGEFLLLDAFNQPIEAVEGEIVRLMKGETALYAMIQTERGLRPGRLAFAQQQTP